MNQKSKELLTIDNVIKIIPVLLLIVGIVYIGIMNPYFLKINNLISVLLATTTLALMSIGMTLVLITGGIDLSIPPVMALSAIIGTMFMSQGGNWLLALIIMLGIGVFCGAVNGFAIAYLNMIPFVVTLSLQMITYGACLWIAGGTGVTGISGTFRNVVMVKLGIVPFPIILMFLLMFVTQLLLKRSYLGRQLYITGTNDKMANVSGIPAKKVVFSAYVLSGLLASIAGIIYVARMSAASVSMGDDTVVTDIVGAAVIGGASTNGGLGSAAGAVFGAIFINILGNAANMLNISYNMTLMTKGFIIILFVALDVWRRGRRTT